MIGNNIIFYSRFERVFYYIWNNFNHTKMKIVSIISILLISFSFISFSQTVTIGSQVWMNKNLDVNTFRNGDTIPEVKTIEDWVKAGENKQPAWCY